jgi:hypothetical protein
MSDAEYVRTVLDRLDDYAEAFFAYSVNSSVKSPVDSSDGGTRWHWRPVSAALQHDNPLAWSKLARLVKRAVASHNAANDAVIKTPKQAALDALMRLDQPDKVDDLDQRVSALRAVVKARLDALAIRHLGASAGRYGARFLAILVPPSVLLDKHTEGALEKQYRRIGQYVWPLVNLYHVLTGEGQTNVDLATGQTTPPRQPEAAGGPATTQASNPRRGHAKGHATKLLIAGLLEHHKYVFGGGVSNFEPVDSNRLAKRLRVGKGTASEFFKKQFGSYAKYEHACMDRIRLTAKLIILAGDCSEKFRYGRTPPGEGFDED